MRSSVVEDTEHWDTSNEWYGHFERYGNSVGMKLFIDFA
jgi:hypothetical protein